MTTIQQFDFSIDLLKACLWQYEDATKLQSLLKQKQAWYTHHQTQFWQDWYKQVFDLNTANDFGLAVWSIILEVPLNYGVAGSGNRVVFGFETPNGNYSKWDGNTNTFGTNFGRDADAVLGLTTEQKRMILKLRYYQLISRGAVPEVNQFLKMLFGSGVYALDGLDMTYTFVFTFMPDDKTLFILENFDVLPRPAGVEKKVLIQPTNSFGFDPYYLNFENSNFYSY